MNVLTDGVTENAMTFYESLNSIVQAIGSALTTAFQSVASIFYNNGQITFVGYLALGTLSISLLGLGIRTLLKLIKQKA